MKAAGEYEKDLEKYQRGIFKPKRAAGRLELFQTSPDFYIASSDSTSKMIEQEEKFREISALILRMQAEATADIILI